MPELILNSNEEYQRRKSVCNVDIEYGLAGNDHVTQARNKPLKNLEASITRKAKAHVRAGHFFSYFYVSMSIIATAGGVIVSTFSSVMLVKSPTGLVTANLVVGAITMFINFILTKFALEGRSGRHLERAKNYSALANKLRYEKLVTDVNMWGNLYLEVYRDFTNIERDGGNLSIPAFIASKSDKTSSDGSVETVLPISPVPLTIDSSRFPSSLVDEQRRASNNLVRKPSINMLQRIRGAGNMHKELPPPIPKLRRENTRENNIFDISSSDKSNDCNDSDKNNECNDYPIKKSLTRRLSTGDLL